MKTDRRFELVEHLSETELDNRLNEAQTTDETRLVRRVCFVKHPHAGDTLEEAGRRVGDSQLNSSRWARAWTEDGVDGLLTSFGDGRPSKLSAEQFPELWRIREDDQPWTPHHVQQLIEDRYSVTSHPSHLSRLLRNAGMSYTTPRPEDPRQPPNAEEILAERLTQALGERADGSEPVIGFVRSGVDTVV